MDHVGLDVPFLPVEGSTPLPIPIHSEPPSQRQLPLQRAAVHETVTERQVSPRRITSHRRHALHRSSHCTVRIAHAESDARRQERKTTSRNSTCAGYQLGIVSVATIAALWVKRVAGGEVGSLVGGRRGVWAPSRSSSR